MTMEAKSTAVLIAVTVILFMLLAFAVITQNTGKPLFFRAHLTYSFTTIFDGARGQNRTTVAMYIGCYYRLKHFIPWTRKKIYLMLALSIVPTTLFYFLGWKWLAIPWVPVALLGTAAAFISGFRNTQTYNRWWEARQIYGAIINSSRTFGIMARDFVRMPTPEQDESVHKELFYRHFAWLTAMRFQLRETKPWESLLTRSYNREYMRHYKIPERETKLEDELRPFLSPMELARIMGAKNKATQLLAHQSNRLKDLNKSGYISEYSYPVLEQQLRDLYDHEGRCERIKNTPYPRQFSSVNLYFTNTLCAMLPFGFLGEFTKLVDKFGEPIIWLTVPFSVLIGWVFLVLEQIGEVTENPFEGGPNDVPITQISRNIEIDMREMLGETELPEPAKAVNDIVM